MAEVISPSPPEQHSLSDAVRMILQDIGRIIRGEIQLARTEIRDKARRAGKAGSGLGIAALSGLLAAGCLVAACIAALALVMAVWLAALAMGILLLLIAAAAYSGARRKLAHVDPVPEQTVATVEDNIEWLKQRTKS